MGIAPEVGLLQTKICRFYIRHRNRVGSHGAVTEYKYFDHQNTDNLPPAYSVME